MTKSEAMDFDDADSHGFEPERSGPMPLSDDAFGDFLRRAKAPLLKADEEVELARRIEAGGPDGERAELRMIESNLRLVHWVARQFKARGVEHIDLVLMGYYGLMQAVRGFDYTTGYRFSTYATWQIRRAIRRGIAATARPIHLPKQILELIDKVIVAQERLRAILGHDPSPEEIARELEGDVSPEQVAEALSVNQLSYPLELGEELVDDQYSAVGSVPSHEYEVVDRLDYKVGKRRLEALLQLHLTYLQLQVLRARFGLDDGQPQETTAIAERMGVTRQYISRVVQQALEKLRAAAKFDSGELRSCLEMVRLTTPDQPLRSAVVGAPIEAVAKPRRSSRRTQPAGPVGPLILRLLENVGGEISELPLAPSIARRIGQDRQSVANALEGLRSRGLVVLVAASVDGSRPQWCHVHLTSKGRALAVDDRAS